MRHPRAAEVLFHGFMLDLPACFLMYLPVIFIWPLWLWWALMLPRLSRWVLAVDHETAALATTPVVASREAAGQLRMDA